MQPIMHRTIKTVLFAGVCQLLLCMIAPKTILSQNLEEYRVKAAFVYNFTKLIQWPQTAFDSAQEHFNISVFGNEQLKESFETIDGKTSAGRVISIRYPDPESKDLKQTLADSQIVFISRHMGLEQVLQILKNTRDRPILTIGEIKSFSRAGGIIQFFTRDDHLHFEINIQSAQTHQLKFSSRLLKLAVIVNEK